jgi:hypothetical protein
VNDTSTASRRLGRRRTWVVVFHLSLLTSHAVSVSAGPRLLTTGQAGHAFLKIPASARAASLGEAFVAWTGDASGLEFNPATVAAMPDAHVALTHELHYMDSSFSAVAAAVSRGRLGAGLLYRRFSAEDDARDSLGAPDGDIGHDDSLAGAAAAWRFGKRLALGAAVKSVSRRIEKTGGAAGYSVRSSAWAADAGVLFALREGGTLGASIQNAGARSRFELDSLASTPGFAGTEGAREALPTVVRLGGVHPAGPWTFAWAAAQPRDGRTAVSAGAEIPLGPLFALRTGLRLQRYLDVNLGFGAGKGPVRVDYAFSPRVDIGNAHRVTLGLRY